MRTKCFEIRDSMTFIPVAAMTMDCFNNQGGAVEGQRYLLRRAGYNPFSDDPTIILVNLNDCRASNDPYGWGNSRTMSVAHRHIESNWDKLSDGDVVDVEYILGDTNECKVSERVADIR